MERVDNHGHGGAGVADGHGHGGGANIEFVTEDGQHIHMPGPSHWPFTLAFFLFLLMIGFMFFPHAGKDAAAWQWIVTGVLVGISAVGMGWSIVAWGVMISEA